MKSNSKKNNKPANIKVDKSLNQFDNVILAPKKVEEANEWLRKIGDLSKIRDAHKA